MNKKDLIAGSIGVALLGGVILGAPINEYELTCNTTMVVDRYATKSGNIEDGYYDPSFMSGIVKATATSSEKYLIPISPIGTQKKANCVDQNGKRHTVNIDDSEYQKHAVKGSPSLKIKRSTTIFDTTI